GADKLARGFSALHALADGMTMRQSDVLRLDPDALLVFGTIVGTARASGGAFEIPAINLFLFGPDGRIVRHEAFDVEREAEAISRFEALTAPPAPTRSVARRVRPNAATESGERFAAAIASRDLEAFG